MWVDGASASCCESMAQGDRYSEAGEQSGRTMSFPLIGCGVPVVTIQYLRCVSMTTKPKYHNKNLVMERPTFWKTFEIYQTHFYALMRRYKNGSQKCNGNIFFAIRGHYQFVVHNGNLSAVSDKWGLARWAIQKGKYLNIFVLLTVNHTFECVTEYLEQVLKLLLRHLKHTQQINW